MLKKPGIKGATTAVPETKACPKCAGDMVQIASPARTNRDDWKCGKCRHVHSRPMTWGERVYGTADNDMDGDDYYDYG